MGIAAMRCIIIDDEVEVRNRLECLLQKMNGVEVIATAGAPEQAIETVLELKPDLVFIDVEMPRMNGFEVVKQIREQQFFPTFIFVTAYNQYAIKAIKSEAFDFLLKPVDIEELAATIERLTIKQQKPIKSIAKLPALACLSEREKDVVELLLKGHTSKEIADKLFISKATVDTHRRNILEKTGLKSTIELFSLQ
jgi:Response regulator containing a CheY-like receiver domain and an HTH DNA-binding domain